MSKLPQLSRRRFLQILGTTTASVLLEPRYGLATSPSFSWSGVSLGAASNLTLIGIGKRRAEQITQTCLNEVERLENIFSLFKPGSSIRELNKEGQLKNPPAELVELLVESRKLSELSEGAFDVSIQPLWKYLFYLSGELDIQKLNQVKELVDYRNIQIEKNGVSLSKRGMEITLNGIAQGFITDRVTHLLREQGIEHVLVQMGESYGLGLNSESLPWRVGIANPESSGFADVVELKNRALATSGAYGTRFASQNHLFDARAGSSVEHFKSVSVLADRAMIADGLSTTLSLLSEDKHLRILNSYPGTKSIIQL